MAVVILLTWLSMEDGVVDTVVRLLFKVECRLERLILLRLRVCMVRGGGRGVRQGISSWIKSLPAMKGEVNCVKEMMGCDFFIINRSRVVCDWLLVWNRWWVGEVDAKVRA